MRQTAWVKDQPIWLLWLPTVAGAALGIMGILAGALTTWTGRRHDKAQADLRFAGEQKAVHAQWQRDRRADAYLAALDVAYAFGEWVHYVLPIITPAPEPTMPPPEVQLKARAAVNALGSGAVRSAADAWYDAARRARREVQFITNGGGDRTTLDELRVEVTDKRDVLAAEINAELGTPDAGP